MYFSNKDPKSEDCDLPEDAQLSPEEEEQLQTRIGMSKWNQHIFVCICIPVQISLIFKLVFCSLFCVLENVVFFSFQLTSSRDPKTCFPMSRTTSAASKTFWLALKSGEDRTRSLTTMPTSHCACPSCWTPSSAISCCHGTLYRYFKVQVNTERCAATKLNPFCSI